MQDTENASTPGSVVSEPGSGTPTERPAAPPRKRLVTVPRVCAAVSVVLFGTAGALFGVTWLSAEDDAATSEAPPPGSVAPLPPEEGLQPYVPLQIRDAATDPDLTTSVTDDPAGPAALLADGPGRNPYVVTSNGQYRTLPLLVDAQRWDRVTVRLFPNGRSVVYAGDTDVVLLDLTSGSSRTVMGASDPEAGIDVLAVSPDSRLLLVSDGGDPVLVDIATQEETSLERPDRTSGPTAGAFARDGDQVAVSFRHPDRGTVVTTTDLREGTGYTARYDGAATLVGPGAFSPDGSYLLLARPSLRDASLLEVVPAEAGVPPPAQRSVLLGRSPRQNDAVEVSNIAWRTDDTLLANVRVPDRGTPNGRSRLTVVGLDGRFQETVTSGVDPFEVAASIVPQVRGAAAAPRPGDSREDVSSGEPDALILLIALVTLVLAGMVGMVGVVFAVVDRARRRRVPAMPGWPSPPMFP